MISFSSYESRTLPRNQVTEITAFANKIKDSGYNYRGIVEFIPFMVIRQMCSLNPFSEDFRQQCVSGLAKAQLSSVGEGRQKVVVLFGICH